MRNADANGRRLRLRLALLLAALAALIGLAVAWSWSPLKAWLDIDLIVGSLQALGASFGPAATMAGFALAVAAAVPLTFLTLVAIVAFGPWTGFACALPGAVIGASISYGVGAWLGHEAVERLAGERINELSQRLARRGVLAIVIVRLTPVAPFAIVNMVAGASHIRLRDLLLGTAIGMMPSTVVMMLFLDRIIEGFKHPSEFGLLAIALSALLIVLGGWGMHRWLRHLKAGEQVK